MQAQLIGLYFEPYADCCALSESLFLSLQNGYVCMFLPNRSCINSIFALLGTFGSNGSLYLSDFDPYPFPHITICPFIISHLALLGNCLICIFSDIIILSLWAGSEWCGRHFLMNALLVINMLTKGSYGFSQIRRLLAIWTLAQLSTCLNRLKCSSLHLVSDIFKRVEQTGTVTLAIISWRTWKIFNYGKNGGAAYLGTWYMLWWLL